MGKEISNVRDYHPLRIAVPTEIQKTGSKAMMFSQDTLCEVYIILVQIMRTRFRRSNHLAFPQPSSTGPSVINGSGTLSECA